MRNVAAVIAGIVLGVLTVAALEALGHKIYPPPEGIDPSNKEAMKTFMQEISMGAKIAVLIAWFFGSLVAGITALKISGGNKMMGWIPVAALLLFGIATLFMFPHPVWMIIGAIFLPMLAGWLAQNWFAKT